MKRVIFYLCCMNSYLVKNSKCKLYINVYIIYSTYVRTTVEKMTCVYQPKPYLSLIS